MKYELTIAERESLIPLYIATWKDAVYWAKRTIKLGSKGVAIWKNNNMIVRFAPITGEINRIPIYEPRQ